MRYKNKGITCILCMVIIFSVFFATMTMVYADVCPKGEHHYTVTVERYATANRDGIRRFTCDICGYSYTEAIPATGHHYTKKYIDPTCTEAGKIIYTCSKCGKTYEESYDSALGHNYIEKDIAPTETQSGKRIFTCSRCGKTYTERYGKPTGKTEKDKDSDSEGNISGENNGSEDLHQTESTSTPFQLADGLIIGANGFSALFFLLLLIPYFKVLIWVRRKKEEALADDDDDEEESK